MTETGDDDSHSTTPDYMNTSYPDFSDGFTTEYDQENFDDDDDIAGNAILTLLG